MFDYKRSMVPCLHSKLLQRVQPWAEKDIFKKFLPHKQPDWISTNCDLSLCRMFGLQLRSFCSFIKRQICFIFNVFCSSQFLQRLRSSHLKLNHETPWWYQSGQSGDIEIQRVARVHSLIPLTCNVVRAGGAVREYQWTRTSEQLHLSSAKVSASQITSISVVCLV